MRQLFLLVMVVPILASVAALAGEKPWSKQLAEDQPVRGTYVSNDVREGRARAYIWDPGADILRGIEDEAQTLRRRAHVLPAVDVERFPPLEVEKVPVGFDWMTWGIWAIGAVIFVVWVIVPIREFRGMLRRRREAGE